MRKRTMIYLLLAVFIIGIVLVGWKLTSRSNYESAAYETLEQEGLFELREYPDLMLATTSASVAAQGNDGSFGKLFGYINGGNEDSTKISMTTPVFMEAESETTGGQMKFVLPAEVAAGSIPIPNDQSVEITKRAGGRFAVLRFSGSIDEETIAAAETQLREWIKTKGWTTTDENAMEYAGYDPPWTPGVMRRNEVLIQVE